jgi:hypothetical protein
LALLNATAFGTDRGESTHTGSANPKAFPRIPVRRTAGNNGQNTISKKRFRHTLPASTATGSLNQLNADLRIPLDSSRSAIASIVPTCRFMALLGPREMSELSPQGGSNQTLVARSRDSYLPFMRPSNTASISA